MPVATQALEHYKIKGGATIVHTILPHEVHCLRCREKRMGCYSYSIFRGTERILRKKNSPQVVPPLLFKCSTQASISPSFHFFLGSASFSLSICFLTCVNLCSQAITSSLFSERRQLVFVVPTCYFWCSLYFAYPSKCTVVSCWLNEDASRTHIKERCYGPVFSIKHGYSGVRRMDLSKLGHFHSTLRVIVGVSKIQFNLKNIRFIHRACLWCAISVPQVLSNVGGTNLWTLRLWSRSKHHSQFGSRNMTD